MVQVGDRDGQSTPLRPGPVQTLGRFLAWMATADPARATAALLLMTAQGLAPAVSVWIFSRVVGQGLGVYQGTLPPGVLLRWLALWAAVGLVQRSLWPTFLPLMDHLRGAMEDTLFGRLQDKARRLRLEAFERADLHDLLARARAAADPGMFLNLLLHLFEVPRRVLTAVAVAVVVVRWNAWLLAATSVAAFPAPLAQVVQARAAFFLQRKQIPLIRLRQYLFGLLQSREAAKEVRAFDIEPWISRWWERIWWRSVDEEFAQERAHSTARAGLEALSALGFGAAVAWAGWSVAHGRLEAGQFAAVIVALQQLQGATGMVAGSVGFLGQQLLKISDLYAYLDLGPEERHGGAPVGEVGDIVLEGVSFSYPGAAEAALRQVTSTLRAGERVALVGENGSGKTTLVKLLTGLFQPTEGRVLLGGRDLRTLDLAELRDRTAAVFQDHIHYAFTLHENVGYGRHERLRERAAVESAAARGGADEVALALPQGYDTLLTRRFSGGTELSGGQWQRVAVSRGFMRDAPLVVLDEPTAALDPKAEADVFRRFSAMAGDRTAVLVSHRLGSARLCDRVLVLRKGRLVEQGTHDELVAAGGEYARMWALQAQWYR